MPATHTDATLHPAASAELLAELGVPDDCGHRHLPGNPCRARLVAMVDVRQLAAEVAILRDRADEEAAKPRSRRRYQPESLRAGAAARETRVRELVAALPPCTQSAPEGDPTP
ncbi:MAG: hypothetical protein EPO06_11900 [Burkholderiaceae bacterium]|nr:MAG: hypothetical protein EPO06_11900 [Burkholderiaceae bacterium]